MAVVLKSSLFNRLSFWSTFSRIPHILNRLLHILEGFQNPLWSLRALARSKLWLIWFGYFYFDEALALNLAGRYGLLTNKVWGSRITTYYWFVTEWWPRDNWTLFETYLGWWSTTFIISEIWARGPFVDHWQRKGMGVQQDAQSYAERAHLYSSRIGTVWWFVNFFFRVLIVGGMAKDFLGNELIIQYI